MARERPLTTPDAERVGRLVPDSGRVNQHDLAEILTAAQVDPTYYALDADRHEALCLTHTDGPGWRVFQSERGQRYEERLFADEDAACVYFLKRIFALWRPE